MPKLFFKPPCSSSTLNINLWIAEGLSAWSFDNWIPNAKSGAQRIKVQSDLHKNHIYVKLCSLNFRHFYPHLFFYFFKPTRFMNWFMIDLWFMNNRLDIYEEFISWSFSHWIPEYESGAQRMKFKSYLHENLIFI